MPSWTENHLRAAQESSILFVSKEGRSSLKWQILKKEKRFEKNLHALSRDSLGELGMQAAPFKADKVGQFLSCVGG